MNRKGWIRIVEAFIAVLLVAGVLLLLLNQQDGLGEDISNLIYNTQISILREIQINEPLRQAVLDVPNASLPVWWTEGEYPASVKARIEERTTGNLDCRSKVCSTSDECNLVGLESPPEYEGRDVYAQDIIITTTLESGSYDPRRLKLFCWVK